MEVFANLFGPEREVRTSSQKSLSLGIDARMWGLTNAGSDLRVPRRRNHPIRIGKHTQNSIFQEESELGQKQGEKRRRNHPIRVGKHTQNDSGRYGEMDLVGLLVWFLACLVFARTEHLFPRITTEDCWTDPVT
jgi:hypothetical protein